MVTEERMVGLIMKDMLFAWRMIMNDYGNIYGGWANKRLFSKNFWHKNGKFQVKKIKNNIKIIQKLLYVYINVWVYCISNILNKKYLSLNKYYSLYSLYKNGNYCILV